MSGHNRLVAGDGIAVNIDTGQRKAVLWCREHTLGVVLDLADSEFGQRLGRFFADHRTCDGGSG